MSNEPDSPTDQERERLLLHRMILHTAMDGFWMLDLEGNLLEVNEAYSRMSGYSEAELLRMRIADFEVLESPTETQAHMEAVLRNGAERFETKHRRKDGSVYDVEISVQFQPSGEGRMVAFLRDITDRRNAEEAFRMNQEMFSQFMLHSPIYAYIKNVTSLESRVIEASENYVDMLGIPGSQMRGKSMHELFPAEFADKMTEDDKTVVTKGDILHLLEEFNGRYYTTIKFPINLRGNQLLAGYTIDITDQKLAEIALLEKEKLLLESQAVANLGSYAWDIRTGLWESSPVLDQIFGIDDTYVRSLVGWATIIHPGWRKDMNAYVVDDVVGKRQKFDREYKIIHQRSGQERWVHGLGRLEYDENDQPIRMIGTITDITERKLAEERLQLLLKGIEQSSAMIMITDPDGTIEFVNAQFTEVTGFSPEEAIGNNPRILKSDDSGPEEYRRMWQLLKAGNTWQGEFRNRKKSGELYWESALISPIVNEIGEITHFLAVKEDITQRKLAENELLRAKEHAERMGKLKDAFIANISHEIRTPLNAIVGFTTILEDRCGTMLDSSEQAYFTHIQFAAQRLMRTVDLILLLSRIQAGDIQLQIETFDLSPRLAQLRESFIFAAKQKEIFIAFRNDIGDVRLTTDEYRLTEAVSNLLHNAIKFTSTGGVTLHLHSRGDSRLFLDIIDTGVGISEEYKPYLFEPYSQEDIGYSRRFEGIGLGMTLVKKYLELLELPIEYESSKDKGTTFSIELTSVLSEEATDGTVQRSS